MKEGSQNSLTPKSIVRTCLQVHIHGQWMLPSLMRSFVGQSRIRELCPPAFHELTVDLLLPVCFNRTCYCLFVLTGYTQIYICIYLFIYLFVWFFVYLFTRLQLHTYVYMHICKYKYIYIYTHFKLLPHHCPAC